MHQKCLLVAVFVMLSATVAGAVTFPVSRSPNGRYLQDATGAPFPILGRTAWFITSLTQAGYQRSLVLAGPYGQRIC